MKKVGRLLGLVCAVAVVTSGRTAAEVIDPGGYAHAVRIVFDGYAPSSPLTNFPTLLTLEDGYNGFHYADMESDDYSDLRFTRADGTSAIPYEVEAWNSAVPEPVLPADVAGCLLWLRADVGVQTDGAGGVTNWLDQSGSGNDAASQAVATHPLYVTNVVNGQPVVRFSGANDNYIRFPRLTNIRTVFWIIKEDSDAVDSTRFLLGDQGGNTYQFHRGLGKMIWHSSHASLMFNGTTELNGTEIDGRTTLMPNGMSVLCVRTAGDAIANSLSRDRAIDGRSWDGDLAELIIYDRTLTPHEMAGVYLYLEAKYGIDVDVEASGATRSSVWVQIPVLTNNAAIYAYWGNTNATVAPAYTTNGAVWSESFSGVWHLHSTNAAAGLPDSTSGDHTGVNNGTLNITGPIGYARNWPAANSITLPAAALAQVSDQVTVSFWQSGNGTGNRTIFGANKSGRRILQSHHPWGGQVYFDAGDDGNTYDRINRAVAVGEYTGGWSHWVYTKNINAGTMRIYRNGTEWHSGTGRNRSMAGADTFRLGSNAGGGETYRGSIDEFRVSTVERSADWIAASYLNQSNPGSFASFERAFFWDTSTSAGLQAGNGTWSTTNAAWSSTTFGTIPLGVWENGSVASFVADGVSTVKVETIAMRGMVVDGSGYVFSGGSLSIERGGVTANESMGILSAITLADSQEWHVASNMVITVDGTIDNGGYLFTVGGDGDVTLAGVVGGTGALTKYGTGTLLIDAYNTYTGGTYVNGGTVRLNRGGNTGAIRGSLTVEAGGQVELTAANALGWGGARVTTLNINDGLLNNAAGGDNGWAITINMTGGELRSSGGVASSVTPQLFSLGGGSTVRTLAGTNTALISGRVNLRENNAGNSLPFQVADGSAATDLLVSAVITEQGGARAIKKLGGGVMAVSADNLYTGGTTVENGALLVNNTIGSGVGSGIVTLNGGTLGGTGTVGAPVTVGASGGFVAPGEGVGTLRINGDLDLTSTGTAGLHVELNGTNAYDVLTVTGAVTLGESLLVGELGYAPSSNDTFFILVNETTNAISGTFKGIVQGGSVEIDGYSFTLSYEGNSATATTSGGNDVVLFNPIQTSGPSGPGDAPYWMEIGFPGYTRATPLTNFPALVVLREDMPGFSYGGFLSAAGDDLRFFSGTNTGATELNYEIEDWNTNDASFVWVQIPVLTNATTIWAYWGDTNNAASPAYATNGMTWDDTFLGVWHFNDASGGIGAVTDSTTNHNHASSTNGPAFGVAGQVGPAVDFSAGNDYIDLPNLGSGDRVTVQCWFKQDAQGANLGLVSQVPWTAGNVHFKVDGNDLGAHLNNGGTPSEVDGISIGKWYHAAYTFSGAGRIDLYRDGLNRAAASGNGQGTVFMDYEVGSEYGGRYFDGIIDEVRVSRVARSADWLWACYENQLNPASFMGIHRASYWDTSPALGLQAGDMVWDDGVTPSWSANDVLGSSPLLTWGAGMDDAHFKADGPSVVSISNAAADRVFFDAPGYTLIGETLVLGDGITANESATVNATVALAGDQNWVVTSNKTLTLGGKIDTGSCRLTIAGDGNTIHTGGDTSRSIVGVGGLTKDGSGTLTLGTGFHNGWLQNSYSGYTIVNGGELVINVGTWTAGSEIGSRLVVNAGGRARCTQPHMFGYYGKTIEVNEGGVFTADSGFYVDGVVMTGGTIDGGGGMNNWGGFTSYAANTTATVRAGYTCFEYVRNFNVADGVPEIDALFTKGLGGGQWWGGQAGVTKIGSGTMQVDGNCTYPGATTVSDGTLLVNGAHTGMGAFTIDGGTLGGTGSIANAVSFGANGGAIAPGSTTGTLTVHSNVTFTTAGAKRFIVQAAGGGDGEYGQLAVNGTVALDNADLVVLLEPSVGGGERLFVIVNDGADPVDGVFNGVANGGTAMATVAGEDNVPVRVFYTGDADTGSTSGGNDVVLVPSSIGMTLFVR